MSTLKIVKQIAARPEIVFDAMVEPEGLKAWIGPDAGPVLIAESDARIGGKYRLRFRMLDGSEHEAAGEYLEVDRPHKLAMTWQWQTHQDRTVSRVEATLKSVPGGTELTFIHSQLSSDEERDGHLEGWKGALDKLVAHLGYGAGPAGNPDRSATDGRINKEKAMTGTSADKAAIVRRIEEWTRAIGAKDADAVAEFFTTDVVTFDLAPPLKNSGFDRKMMDDWFKTWQSRIGYEVTDQVIEVGDRIAVARSLDHMTGIKTDGEKVDVWTRSTVCFRKEGQDWRVMHVHSSVPFHMDGSLKAAVDLKP